MSGERTSADADGPATAPPGPLSGQAPTLAVIAAGGALGALGRYGVAVALPTAPGAFPLTTLLVNVSGCLLIGAVIVLVTEVRRAHPLVRPFVATGILGGYTTFSTYATDAEELLRAGRVGTAVAYLGGTLFAALAATWLGLRLARALMRAAAGRPR